MTAQTAHEYRCDCGKLLGKSDPSGHSLEVKCRRCERLTRLESQAPAAQNVVVFINPQGLVKRFGPFGVDS